MRSAAADPPQTKTLSEILKSEKDNLPGKFKILHGLKQQRTSKC